MAHTTRTLLHLRATVTEYIQVGTHCTLLSLKPSKLAMPLSANFRETSTASGSRDYLLASMRSVKSALEPDYVVHIQCES